MELIQTKMIDILMRLQQAGDGDNDDPSARAKLLATASKNIRDDMRRTLIKSAIELHLYKGTPWSIREIIRRFGFGEVNLIEGAGQNDYDGKHSYNGLFVHGDVEVWEVYRVILQQPITND